jgi:hypothetical protein
MYVVDCSVFNLILQHLSYFLENILMVLMTEVKMFFILICQNNRLDKPDFLYAVWIYCLPFLFVNALAFCFDKDY